MAPQPPSLSRRTALRSTGVALAAALAGCPGGGSNASGDGYGGSGDGSGGGGDSDDPDAGRDSYGVLVRNRTGGDQPVSVTVEKPFEGETFLEESVTVPANGTKEWDGVMTKKGEYAVNVKLTGDIDGEGVRWPGGDETTWVNVGAEETPPAANIVATIDRRVFTAVSVNASESDERKELPTLSLGWPEKYQDG